MAARNNSPLDQFKRQDLQAKPLTKEDFTLSNASQTGDLVEIARFEAPYPIALREESLRLMFTVHEAFAHTGTGTAEATFNLSNNALETSNTAPAVVYKDGTLLSEGDSTPDDDEYYLDYSNDQLTVDVDEDVTIHIFYVARNNVKVELWKESPGTTGKIDERIYDDWTADLHERDQNQNPPSLSFNTSPYKAIIPEKWNLVWYADSDDYKVQWDDSDTDTTGSKTVNSTTATNAVMRIPAFYSPKNIEGLASAVSSDIGTRRGV